MQDPLQIEIAEQDAETPSTVQQGGGLRWLQLYPHILIFSFNLVLYSFMTLLFSDPEWRKNNAAILRTLAGATRAAEPVVEPRPLPPVEDARSLFDN